MSLSCSLLYRLTSGVDNILLHYVNLCPGRGAMICPTYATPPGPVQSELLKCFQRTCLSVREVLHGRVMDEKVRCVESDSDSEEEEEDEDVGSRNDPAHNGREKKKATPSPFAPLARSVVEHGVLLHCTPPSPEKHKKRPTPTLHYWVVG